MQFLTPPRNSHARVVAKQILSLVISYVLIFSSATTFTSATVRAQSVDEPKLKTSNGEAVLKTTEPLQNLPSHDEMKRKGKENDDAEKIIKVKKDSERLPQAVRCRPADTACQEYWKKKGKPSTNISLLTPSENSTNSFANLIAANKNPFESFASLFSTSDIPNTFSSYRPPTSAYRTPPALVQASAYGGWQNELAQRRNEAGGDSLFSGNYYWSVPVVSLPGRAGHDLNLSLSYNSHVWVRMTGGMEMDGFHFLTSNPGSGFSIGLPLLQSVSHITRTNNMAYLLTMPSGQQIELIRRAGSAGGPPAFQIYESQDGSLLRLTIAAGDRRLYFPNGTRIQFDGNSQLQYIQDRNGNQITATYDPNNGLMNKITDTLGREIIFEYNAYFLLSDIKRTRLNESNQTETITLAHFGYADVPINTNPSGWTGYPNALLPMVKSVQLANGSLYCFEYNSYGQVKTRKHYGPISTASDPNILSGYRLLSTADYNFPSTNTPANNAAQTDCPRFTTRTDSAADWKSSVVTNFTRTATYGEVMTPDGTKSREYYNLASGSLDAWQNGLVYKTELCDSTGTVKRTTLTSWSFWGSQVRGPVVTDSTVTDNENGSSRYSEFEYNSYNLPITSTTWKGATLLQRTTTAYLLTSAYVSPTALAAGSRWIIGLPSESNSYASNDAAGSSFTNLSRVTYQYDQVAPTATATTSVMNHNTAAFGTGFTARGNLTCVTKWDTITPANSISTTTKYNTTGSPIEQFLPDNNLTGRSNKISYTDSFSDNADIANTFAYPTTMTDPDGFSSKIKYRYDIGAVTKTSDPKMIAADATKAIVKTYDAIGRLKRVDNEFSGAATRYTYDTSFAWVNTYNKVDASTEDYSATQFDGHGRVRASSSLHPGSVGGYRGQFNIFDNMGRTIKSSNPTEINGGWLPEGDDTAYIYSQQTYDYKGRPKITTNQDGSTKQYEYGGCGCTGEATVTITDEVGRKQRQISDAYLDNATQVDKTEVLNWNGTVYSTTVTVNDVLNRKTFVRQYKNAVTNYMTCPTGDCQESWTQYDGYGRAFRNHKEIEVGSYPYTEFEYYADSSIKKATDARGAISNYYYNLRGLVQSRNYAATSWAASTIQASAPVSFEYNNLGARTKMTDELGEVNYVYDTLNRMTSETRNFSNLNSYNSSNFTGHNGVISNYTLAYEYDLRNQLTKITDPWGGSVSYQRDLSGRVSSMTADGYGNYDPSNNMPITNIVSNMKYRANDSYKQFDKGTIASMAHFEYAYNAQLLPTQINQGGRISNHTYYSDGKVQDTSNNYRTTYNSHFEYDHAGRLRLAKAGNNADWTKNPYLHIYEYNVFGDTTKRTGDHEQNPPGNTPSHYWSSTLTSFNATWTNHRDSNLVYDNVGNVFTSGQVNNQAGLTAKRTVPLQADYQTNFYRQSGDGEQTYVNDYITSTAQPTITDTPANSNTNEYYLRSSVLGGQVVASVAFNGFKAVVVPSYRVGIFLNGTRIAEYSHWYLPFGNFGLKKEVKWVAENPVTGNRYIHAYKYSAGVITYEDYEYDPVGARLDPIEDTYVPPNPNVQLDVDRIQGDIHDYRASCREDGALVPCSQVMAKVNHNQGSIHQVLSYNRAWYFTLQETASGKYGGEWGRYTPTRLVQMVQAKDRIPQVGRLEREKKSNFTDAYKDKIWEAFYGFVNNEKCLKAFKDAGVDLENLLAPDEKGKGVNVGLYEYLQDTSVSVAADRLKLTERGIEVLPKFISAATQMRGDAVTIGRPEYLNTGKGALPAIFLTQKLVEGGGRNFLVTLAHELFHAAGKAGRPLTSADQVTGGSDPDNWFSTSHDLDNLPGYDQAIRDCVDAANKSAEKRGKKF